MKNAVIFLSMTTMDSDILKHNCFIQDKFGDQYMIFLLYNPEDNKPVAIITLKELVEPDPPSKSPGIFLKQESFGLTML